MSFRIGVYPFTLWHGTPPQLSSQATTRHTKPGANGIGHVRLGTRGMQFECVLEAWFGGGTTAYNFWLAKQYLYRYQFMVGNGLFPVIYNDIDYQRTFGHLYAIDRIDEIQTTSNILLVGPAVSYTGGAKLVTRFLMTPHALF